MITIPTQPRKITQVVKFGVVLWAKTFTQLLPLILLLTFIVVSFQECMDHYNIDLNQGKKVNSISQAFKAPQDTQTLQTSEDSQTSQASNDPATNDSATNDAATNDSATTAMTTMNLFDVITIIAFLLIFIISSILFPVAMIYHIDAIAHQKNPTILHSLGKGCRKFFPYLVAGFLYGICVLLGFVFLVIPGIYVMIMLLLAPYLVVVRDTGIFHSFKESWDLVSKNWWHTFGTFLLAALIGFVFTMIIFSIFGLMVGLSSVLLSLLNAAHLGWLGNIFLLIIIDFFYISVSIVLTFSMMLSLLYDLEVRRQQKISVVQ